MIYLHLFIISPQLPDTFRPTQPTVTRAHPSWRSNRALSRPLSQAGFWAGTTIIGPPTPWKEPWLSLSCKPSLLALQLYFLTASWSKLPLDLKPSRARKMDLDQYKRAIFNKTPYCPSPFLFILNLVALYLSVCHLHCNVTLMLI